MERTAARAPDLEVMVKLRFFLAVVVAALLVPATKAVAKPRQGCPSARSAIKFYAGSTRRWRKLHHLPPISTQLVAARSPGCEYVRWAARRWRSRALAARRSYERWYAELSDAERWHPDPEWLVAATCIHGREGAWNDNTGNSYYGGLQFLPSTWRRAGGHEDPAFLYPGDQRGHPFTASPKEQLYRMWVVYLADGRSFREWGTAGACGLR